MTLHVMKGSVRNMFVFHSTVVCSCDMGIFLLTSNNSPTEAFNLLKKKVDACKKMIVLYFTEQNPWLGSSMPGWLFLMPAWLDYLFFHIDSSLDFSIKLGRVQNKKLKCKWTDSTWADPNDGSTIVETEGQWW